MNLCIEKAYSFIVIDAALTLDNLLHSRKIFYILKFLLKKNRKTNHDN